MVKKIKKITKKQLKKLEKREINKRDKEWKEKIKERDKVCMICGRNEFLHVHHIIPREIKELRWEVDNGILLCAKHHKFCRKISAHKSPFNFYEFLLREKFSQVQRLRELIKNHELSGIPVN